jgi:hypothetical protein
MVSQEGEEGESSRTQRLVVTAALSGVLEEDIFNLSR